MDQGSLEVFIGHIPDKDEDLLLHPQNNRYTNLRKKANAA
jgi:hypothetical protein